MIARASQWTTSEVAAAVCGRIHGDAGRGLAGVATDTRDALRDLLFVALAGDRFDAHDFLEKAVENGAGALLVTAGRVGAERLSALSATVPVIEVQDSLHGLGELARAHRRRFPGLLVHALTGSNGKTSTKEMLAAILETAGPVLKTEGNLNNLIGAPLTLLGARADHRAAVVELGMNALGEISRLTEIASPDVGLVINVGPAHIGELGSIEAIAQAKGELFAGLDRDRAMAVVNLDDRWVVEMARRFAPARQRTFGRSEAADVRLVERRALGEGQELTLSVDGTTVELELPYPGAHNALNAAAAVATATARTSIDLGALSRGLASARRVAGRLIVEPLGPYWIVDDCYNANGASMLAAIETLAERVSSGGRLVALLGEMRELGKFSAEEHERVGRAAAERGAALVASFGPDAAPIAAGARAAGLEEVTHQDEDREALLAWLLPRLREGDVILVKGSRGIHMERFISRLREAQASGEG